MQYVVTAVPLLVLALIVLLILRSVVRGRVAWTPPVRKPRPKKTTLRSVSRDQMDEDLKDLIRRS
jgi:hypothetical protein